MILINDQNIDEAEKIFINGESFDIEERVPFIKNLESCDLLAVPGSGKTTALMAKLYCLGQHMTTDTNSSILVLSHTNKAVEEIESKLKKHCPHLFEYPNFIGTIQTFVNKFLANQACFQNYGSYIRKNDDEMYENEVAKFYYSLRWSAKGADTMNLVNKLYGLINRGKNGTFDEKKNNIHEFLRKFDYDIQNRKIIYQGQTILKYGGVTEPYYLELEKWKLSLFRSGLLNYRDSFNLGILNLEQNPGLKTILQKRFKFVFIDEMQDLERTQIDLIDEIFCSGSSKTIVQRIGDINQSIYNSGKSVKDNCDWVPRNQTYLTGSNRLTEEIANCVNFFTLDPQDDGNGIKRFVVKGLSKITNPIKPQLLVFNNASKSKLLPKFESLISQFDLLNTDSGKKNGFHILSWSTEWATDEQNESGSRIRLKDIFPDYSRESKQKKEDFDCLRKYLFLYDREKKTLEGIRKSILNALIRILREEHIYQNTTPKTFYRKRDLIEFVKSQGIGKYEDFKFKLYSWSFKIVCLEDVESVYVEIKQFIEEDFMSYNWDFEQDHLPREIKKSSVFIEKSFTKPAEEINNPQIPINRYSILINKSSVHASKGQTHCATMYIESSYFDYETQKLNVVSEKATKTRTEKILPNPLFGEFHSYRLGKDSRAKEALKMMYVGFSRPTHLLCFAALEENVTDSLPKFTSAGWDVHII